MKKEIATQLVTPQQVPNGDLRLRGDKLSFARHFPWFVVKQGYGFGKKTTLVFFSIAAAFNLLNEVLSKLDTIAIHHRVLTLFGRYVRFHILPTTLFWCYI